MIRHLQRYLVPLKVTYIHCEVIKTLIIRNIDCTIARFTDIHFSNALLTIDFLNLFIDLIDYSK